MKSPGEEKPMEEPFGAENSAEERPAHLEIPEDETSSVPVRSVGPGAFTSAEVALLSDGSYFRMRTRVMTHLRRVLEDLRLRLVQHMQEGEYLRPEGVDLSRAKIGRGEYLDEMPYVYLDYPRHFDQRSCFTYRTLFWWGHGVSFSLVLAGEHLQEYRQRLLRSLAILEALDVHVATTETPWDWDRGPGHTMLLAAGEEGTLQRLFRNQNFLKCTRFLGFDEAEFRENRIDDAALLTFRALEPMILV